MNISTKGNYELVKKIARHQYTKKEILSKLESIEGDVDALFTNARTLKDKSIAADIALIYDFIDKKLKENL